VVAITKTDLVGSEGVELAAAEVRELLAGGPYEQAEIAAVSARGGQGLDRLAAALDRAAALPAPESDDAPVRLHVDRCFTLHGVGTVVTGTLWSGVVRAGQVVRIEPAGRRARVRTIEVHGEARDQAEWGQRVALNLAGVERTEVKRGDVVAGGDADLRPTYLIDAVVEVVAGTRPLRRGTRLQLHHGTRETAARIAPIEGESIEAGRRSFAQLRLEQPIVPAAGDRFVLRQIAPPDTVGGGSVLDPAPRKHGPGAGYVERLQLIESGDVLAQLAARIAAASSGLGGADADQALLERLTATGRAQRVGRREPRYFALAQLELARERILTALDRQSPGRPVSAGALAASAGLSDGGARSVLEELVADGEAIRRGPGFVRGGRLAPDPLGERIAALLRQDRLEPRSIEALAAALGCDREEVGRSLERLTLEGRLERVKPGVHYDPAALSEAERRVVEICDRDGFVTIAGLRDELDTSRKYAQALLEHFDARRLTLRRGDRHVLRRRRASSGPVR
jgi:selenocysteine-specific elongation factor